MWPWFANICLYLIRFLRDIEEKKVAPLVGGQAINAVAGDKDPKKMDIAEVFRRFES